MKFTILFQTTVQFSSIKLYFILGNCNTLREYEILKLTVIIIGILLQRVISKHASVRRLFSLISLLQDLQSPWIRISYNANSIKIALPCRRFMDNLPVYVYMHKALNRPVQKKLPSSKIT